MELPLPKPSLMDGATGTQLQARGMPQGVCTEAWALDHPQAVLEVQRAYVAAGAQILLTPTACANRTSLEKFGLANRVEELNMHLTALTRTAAGEQALVAGDLGPVCLSIPPYGDTPFETLVDIYAQQAKALVKAGVDLFVAESLLSMAEVRAAILGVREGADSRLPILVSCFCNDEGRMPGGTDVLAAGIVAQGMGAAAFGVNCCAPQTAEEQLKRLTPYLTIPLLAKPAGNMGGDLASHAAAWAAAGVRFFGGCCGTGPEDLMALKAAVDAVDFAALKPVDRDPDVIPCAGEREARFITPDVDVSEAVECTPDFLEDLLKAEDDPVGAVKVAILSEDDLDVFTGEQYAIQDALCLWSDVPELMEGALRAYQGRAFYDGTADLEPEVLKALSHKYGLIVL